MSQGSPPSMEIARLFPAEYPSVNRALGQKDDSDDERLTYGLGLCLATGLNVLQGCLTRQHASNLHVSLREHSVDEVP